MKIKILMQKYNSTLSCILKCLEFISMIHKKLIFGLLILTFLSSCTAPTAMLGPVYTFASTGSMAQTGISAGSNEIITHYTGKTTFENIKEITNKDEINIHKDTLESEEFYILVKNKIDKTSAILNLTNQ